MRKILCTLLCAVLAAALLRAPAFAVEQNAAIGELVSLGLFKGSDRGLELDSTPKRVEAAVMMVRLLGKEEEARSGTYSHPYTDVPGWAGPYIGYLHENGLINGISNNEFGSDVLCTAKMYVTLVLRTLGFSDKDNEDFSYENALDFAVQIGLIDGNADYEPFTRADMASISYAALFIEPKNSESGTLLTRLVEHNAVSEDEAAEYMERNTLLSELEDVLASISEADTVDANYNTCYIYQIGEDILKFDNNTHVIRSNMDGKSPQMAISQRVKIDRGIPEGGYDPDIVIMSSADLYYLDGYVYCNYNGEKTKMPLDQEDYIYDIDVVGTDDILPYQFIGDIDKHTVGTDTVYTLSFKIEEMLLENTDIYVGNLSEEPFTMVYQFTVDAGGNIKRMTGSAEINIEVEVDGNLTSVTIIIATSMDINVPVIIDLPDDPDTYEEVDDVYVMPEDLLDF